MSMVSDNAELRYVPSPSLGKDPELVITTSLQRKGMLCAEAWARTWRWWKESTAYPL